MLFWDFGLWRCFWFCLCFWLWCDVYGLVCYVWIVFVFGCWLGGCVFLCLCVVVVFLEFFGVGGVFCFLWGWGIGCGLCVVVVCVSVWRSLVCLRRSFWLGGCVFGFGWGFCVVVGCCGVGYLCVCLSWGGGLVLRLYWGVS